MKLLWKSYIGIIVILGITTIVYFSCNSEELKSFTLNLITEIIGILVTILLIDQALRSKEKREKDKIIKSAFVQFKRPANEFLYLLLRIYKATCESKPENLNNNYKDIFSTNHFFETIQYLDFKLEAPVIPRQQWSQYVYNEVTNFKKEIDKILDKYVFVFDSHIIGELESLNNSSILQIISIGMMVQQADIQINHQRENLNLLAGEQVIDELKKFLNKLFNLIDYFNDILKQNDEFKTSDIVWDDNQAPKISSGRIKQNQ